MGDNIVQLIDVLMNAEIESPIAGNSGCQIPVASSYFLACKLGCRKSFSRNFNCLSNDLRTCNGASSYDFINCPENWGFIV